jgi:CP family cyanate transporter-like MFS transporter
VSTEASRPLSGPQKDTRFERWLVVVGVVALAFNLRPAASSVGPVLEEVSRALGMGAAVSGVLTALPVIAFGSFGALAPLAARVVGLHRVTMLSLVALTAGLLARSTVDSTWAFLALSVLALAGMAVANVLLPSLIKLHFPDRIGLFTALYTTSLALGLTAASAFTVPLADGFGSWRGGLAAWAATAAVAAAPWVLLIRHDTAPAEAPQHVSMRQIARTRLGWAMALLFGLQSAQAYTVFGWFAQIYRDAGFSATTAGVLLGVVTGISIPLSLILPILAGRTRDQTRLMLLLIACYPIGYLGLAFFPVKGAWAWALLVGVAASVFPVVLTLIGLRSRTPEGTAALSGFTQSIGYLIAALGPFGIGVLDEVTGGWTLPLLVLSAMAVATGFFAVVAARPRYVEDEFATSG